MDVTIGEVSAQVDTASQGQPARSSDENKPMGITEKSREARLAERRAKRIRERLRAD